MTARDRVINTLCHNISTPVPMFLHIAQSVEQCRMDVCAQLRVRFQNDLDVVDYSTPFLSGKNTQNESVCLDEWGCKWERNVNQGWSCASFPRYDDILELEGIRFPKNPVTIEMTESVNHLCDSDPRFVLVQTRIHPFRRMCALGGVEAASNLVQRKPRELKEIMGRFFDYYKKQIDTWCLTDADAIGMEDDLADEHGNRMSIQRWNEIFVPMYKEYCNKIRGCDKFVFFTGTGNFEEFIPGLIFAGVDCIRFDATVMDPNLLADRYGHRVTFQPYLNPQLLDDETEASLTEKILEIRKAFDEKELIAECQMPLNAPMRRIACAMLNIRRRMPLPD